MKNLLPLAFVFLGLLASCGSKEDMTPIQYNDKIVGEQNKIIEKILAFSNNASEDFAVMDKSRLEAVEQCKSSIKIVEAMKDYEGNTQLRDAAVNLFKFYQQISEESFKEMTDIIKKGADITQDDLNRLEEIQAEMDGKEGTLDAALAKAQDDFSAKYNFSLKRNDVQDQIDEMNE